MALELALLCTRLMVINWPNMATQHRRTSHVRVGSGPGLSTSIIEANAQTIDIELDTSIFQGCFDSPCAAKKLG
jgi:hypothetical protein